MRSLIPGLLLLLFSPAFTFAAAPPSPEAEAKIARLEDEFMKSGPAPSPSEAKAASDPDEEEEEDLTVFNGIEVPPMKELEGHKWDEQTKEGYWFVKHYSPQCPHCIKIAPTWQKLYEFYYVCPSHHSYGGAFYG